MSVSLEGREPFLDHRIIELAARLPYHYKAKHNIGKYILKDIVHEYVPRSLMDRPKMGFSLPIYNWLRTDLGYLLDEYLSDEALKTSGLFNAQYLSIQVEKFKNGKLHHVVLIWYLLMFQMWYKKWQQT